MRRALLISIAAAALLLSVSAGADFRQIVNRIEREGHVRKTSIPFSSFGRFVVRVHSFNGVSDIQLAVFEENPLSSEQMEKIVKSSLGAGWSPMVVATSAAEQSWIYARPHGREEMEMLIVARDTDDTTVVRVVISPEKFADAVKDPGSVDY